MTDYIVSLRFDVALDAEQTDDALSSAGALNATVSLSGTRTWVSLTIDAASSVADAVRQASEVASEAGLPSPVGVEAMTYAELDAESAES